MTPGRALPLLVLVLVACGEAPAPGPPTWTATADDGSGMSAASAALVARGETVYRSNCVACHGLDPDQKGAIGPAVGGASLELLEARVLHATYPPGYTPRQEGAAMPAFPHLEADIPALHAYLQAAARDGG